MTPNLVATSALINFNDSNAPSRGLPGKKTGTAYGDYAAGVWLKALQPSLVKQAWTWPDPLARAGHPGAAGRRAGPRDREADAVGPGLQDAPARSDHPVRSSVTSGSVAYEAPMVAPRGSTITVCASLGVEQPDAAATAAAPAAAAPHRWRQRGAADSGNGGGTGDGGTPDGGSPPSGGPPSGGPPSGGPQH